MDSSRLVLGVVGISAIGIAVWYANSGGGNKIDKQLSSVSKYIAGLGYCNDPDAFAEAGIAIPAVWHFNKDKQTWEAYSRCEGITSFKELVKGDGYWLWASKQCVLEYNDWDYDLYAGWNLIGWLGE